ncbi:hypothetical protein BgiBS90_012077, partial [Biomphalaria glabrata]
LILRASDIVVQRKPATPMEEEIVRSRLRRGGGLGFNIVQLLNSGKETGVSGEWGAALKGEKGNFNFAFCV